MKNKSKEKDYLVFIEQCDDETIVKRMTGEKIRQYIIKHGQGGIAVVDGVLVKPFNGRLNIVELYWKGKMKST